MDFKIKLLIVFTLSIFIGIGGVLFYQSFFYDGESIQIQSEGKEVISQMESLYIDDYHVEMLSEQVPNEKKETPLEIIKLTFSSVYYEKPLLFSQNFLAEQFFDDLMKVQDYLDEEISGEMAELYLINKISRDGKLKDVTYLNTKVNTFNASAKVEIQLLYNDDKKISLTLDLKDIREGVHSKHSRYYITDSIWDIISKIEKS